MTPLRMAGVAMLGLTVGLSGCNPDCGPFNPQVAAVVSGDYIAQELLVSVAQAFPHSGGDQFRLSVDRENGIVEIRYLVQGNEVVERWRVVGSEVLGGP